MKIPDGYVLIPRDLFAQMSRDAEAWRSRPQYPVGIFIGENKAKAKRMLETALARHKAQISQSPGVCRCDGAAWREDTLECV